MYKKSKESTEPTLFNSLSHQIGENKSSKLDDPIAWQNLFYKEITSKIDESIFKPLYDKGNGRPNASIRQLLGMIILKEGHNWTDAQLFESCEFNLLVMRALGLNNLSDKIPSPATYYNFKQALLNYEQTSGVNLLEETFNKITKDQVMRFNISGSAIRMDSKLMQSNIAKTTRLQMALGVVTKFYKSLTEKEKSKLKKYLIKELEEISSKKPEQHTFKLDKRTAHNTLVTIGKKVYKLINIFDGMKSEEYILLERLYHDHFKHEPEDDPSGPEPKQMKGKGGSTIQSAHDPEATYRHKPGVKNQKITGYVSNITDTCPNEINPQKTKKETKSELQLITSVQTAPATQSDDKFFMPAIKKTEDVLDKKVDAVLTDGAYNSEINEQTISKDQEPRKWFLTGMQGIQSEYDFVKIDKQTYKVTDKRTGLEQTTHLTPTGKFRIDEHHTNRKYRYFNKKIITNYFRRKEMSQYPNWVYGQRANGESTIHQVFCKLDGAKSKYRGLFRNHCYVIARCFWVNMTRIVAKAC
jgi:ribosomal protein L20A (L18A)